MSTTRSLSYITPDLCHDAHDKHCADGGRGGLRAADAWFKTWVPRILASPAFARDGVLVITADESEGPRRTRGPAAARAPAPTPGSPASTAPAAGGSERSSSRRSPLPGTTSTRAYNHYSLLGSIEALFGLRRLGYARTVDHVFGADVFNAS